VNPDIPPIYTVTATAATVIFTPVNDSPVASRTGGPQPTATPGSVTPPPSSSGGLGTGAIAGIAVGAALVILGLLLFFFMWHRSKKTAHGSPTTVAQHDIMAEQNPRSAKDTASWVSSQPSKVPESTVFGYGARGSTHYAPSNTHYTGAQSMYNDDDDGMTFAGTVDHNGAPRF
jgi:hypothetical protein